jgi:hypothetical protein
MRHTSATVATFATVPGEAARSVATVASVASPRGRSSSSPTRTVASVATVAAPGGYIHWSTSARRNGSSEGVSAAGAPRSDGDRAVEGVARLRVRLHQAYGRMLPDRGSIRAIQIFDRFLDEHLASARLSGWSDVELFGCHPDPAFALVRYDCMGAVTIAALMHWPLASASATEIRCLNGLATRRRPAGGPAEVVWKVFPDRTVELHGSRRAAESDRPAPLAARRRS